MTSNRLLLRIRSAVEGEKSTGFQQFGALPVDNSTPLKKNQKSLLTWGGAGDSFRLPFGTESDSFNGALLSPSVLEN